MAADERLQRRQQFRERVALLRREPNGADATEGRRVSGRVVFDYGLPASGLLVRLSRLGHDGQREPLGETTTDAGGRYEVTCPAGITPSQLDASVVTRQGEVPLARSGPAAVPLEAGAFDLVAPRHLRPPEPEFARLCTALAPLLPQAADVRFAVDDGARHDVSAVASASGWDPRLVALAAEAFEHAEETGAPAEGLYGLYRCGMPLGPAALSQVRRESLANALGAAVGAGIVVPDAVEPTLRALEAAARRLRLATRLPGTPSAVDDFVGAAPVSDDDRARFREVVVGDDPGRVWERALEAGVSPEGVAALQAQGRLAYLTFNNAPVAALVQSRMRTADVQELFDLDFDRAETWSRVVDGVAGNEARGLEGAVPGLFPGGTAGERREAYAATMARLVRALDPPRATARAVGRGEIEGVPERLRASVAHLLEAGAKRGFRLGRSSWSSFMASDAAAKSRVDPEALEHAKALHRLYGVSPNDDSLAALYNAGLRSASDIARTPVADFVRAFAPKLGSERTAREVHGRAGHAYAAALSLLGGAAALATTPVPAALGGGAGATKRRAERLAAQYPTLEVLFGGVDYCQCDSCRSVLSPTAYFVDLLRFLGPSAADWGRQKGVWEENHPGRKYDTSFARPLDALLDGAGANGLVPRRPDLQHIPLTCANTNTTLPYIDLVNELLEVQVAGGELASATFDTGDTPSETLVAEPQHVRWEAYDILKAATFPIGLPFDLPLEMIRSLLAQLQVPLWRVRELFASPDRLEASGTLPGLMDAWLERLGVGAADLRLLTGGVPWHEAYGYSSAASALADDALRNAQTLARRLGVSYVELVELIKTRFVNPELERLGVLHKLGLDPHLVARHLGTEQPPLSANEASALNARLLQVRDKYPGFDPQSLAEAWSPAAREKILLLRMPASGCDFSAATVALAKAPADEPGALALVLWRLNLFVRLRRIVGWPIADLDVLLGAFVRPSIGDLSAPELGPAMQDALAYLAHVAKIDELAAGDVRRAELVTLWGPIPAPLYEELFLAPGVFGHDPAFDHPLGHYLQNAGVPFGPHAPAVAAALRLRAEDIDAAFAHAGIGAPALTMDVVSLLYRYAVLARLAGCDVPSLVTLLSLSRAEPLRPLADAPLASPVDDSPFSQTIPFLEAARRVADSGQGLAWLRRICQRGGALDEATLRERVDRLLVAIAELSAPADGLDPEHDLRPIVQAVAAQLSASESLVTTLLTDANVLADPASGAALVEPLLAGREVGLTATGDDREALVRFPAYGTYHLELSPPRAATLTIDDGEDVAFGTAATPRAAIAAVEAGRLYRVRVRSAGASSLVVSGPGLSAAPIEALSPLPADAHQRFAGAATRLIQAVELLDALAMTERDLRENASALAVPLRLNALPAAGAPPATEAFDAVLGWWELLDVARALRVAVEDVVSVLRSARLTAPAPGPAAEAALLTQLGAALARVLGRGVAVVLEALDALGMRPEAQGPSAPARYEVTALTTPAGVRRVADVLRAVDACGSSPSRVAEWAAPAPGAATAADVRSALKAHYAGDAWRAVARPVFDRLRPKQRDALVSLLLHRDDTPYRTAEELYEFLLLDPGTEPPVLTTRIQLAISSAQLFVQRCLMGLEARVPPGIVDGKRWAWMRRYRVWEANRKIFLWPENWLEPELRDDKTHMFRRLEGAILQGDASVAVVEAGLRSYLRELESIARLEMVTTYYEAGVSADSWTLHVVGRTPHRPHKYFYRRGSHGMWTPWEPVGVEIEGEHLALALWYDRLHLFWVSFFEQSAAKPLVDGDTPANVGNTKTFKDIKPDQAVGVQLNWVERFEGAWVNRSATPLIDAPTFKNLFVAGQLARDALFIHVINPPVVEGSLADALEVHVSHKAGSSLKFRLDGKLAPPRLLDGESPPSVAHLSASAPRVTKHAGGDRLAVKFRAKVIVEGVTEEITEVDAPILTKTGAFRLLLPTNPVPPNAGGEDRSTVRGRPCSYEPAGEVGPVQYIAYRGGDGHLHLIFGEGKVGSPNAESLWYHADITAAVQGEPLKSDPSGYAWLLSWHQSFHAIAYIGTNGRLYEAYEDAAGWHVDDLTDASSNASPPAGRPLGGALWLQRSVAYRDTDGHVFVVYRAPGAGQAWRRVQVTTELTPRAASNLAAVRGPAAQPTLFFYRDAAGHVIAVGLRGHSDSPSTEGHVDVSAAVPAAPPAGEGDLAVIFQPCLGLYVAYRSADGRVHLLSNLYRQGGPTPSPDLTRDVGAPWPFNPAEWTYEPLGADKPAAAGAPLAWHYGSYRQIAYLGEDKHIHMFYHFPLGSTWRWNYERITDAQGADGIDAVGDLTGHIFRRYWYEDHVIYRTSQGKLMDLRREKASGRMAWDLSEIGLAQTYLDKAGALTAPFFFEDDAYTFFVQPTLTVKSAHEWPGYVPIPGPVPSPDVVAPRRVVAHFPHAPPTGAQGEGDWLAGGPHVLQTARGVFGPDGTGGAGPALRRLPPSMVPRAPRRAAPGSPDAAKPEGSR